MIYLQDCSGWELKRNYSVRLTDHSSNTRSKLKTIEGTKNSSKRNKTWQPKLIERSEFCFI